MRTLTTFLTLGCLATLPACTGRLGDGTGDPNGSDNGTGTNAFGCNPEEAALTPAPIRRLAKEYVRNATKELLSPLDDARREELLATLEARFALIPTDNSEFFSTNDDLLTQDHVDAMFGLAIALAAELDAVPGYADGLATVCGGGQTAAGLEDDGCLTTFVTYYGQKALRRPLSDEEVEDFKGFYAEAKAAGVGGLSAILGRFVAHPGFFYRFDAEGEVVEGEAGVDATYRLTKWELLSKITFLFWAAPPTDALYERVNETDITQDDALSAVLDEVLADPKADQGVLRFYREWLVLDETLTPASEGNLAAGQTLVAAAGLDALPETHREDMIDEVLALTKHYSLTTDAPLDDLLTSPYSFATTPALAAIYGVEPWDGTASGLVAFPAGERGGLVTRAAFLATNTEFTRPVIKGVTIRNELLCSHVPPPPPDLEIEPLVHTADTTTREAVEAATADDLCQTCHQELNALGFLSENYDPIGRYRQTELRFAEDSGEIVAELEIETSAVAKLSAEDDAELADAVELGAALAESGQVHTCMVRNYFHFVTGRAEDATTDACDLEGLHDKLVGDGGSIKAMLKESAMQQSFRQRKVN